MGNDVNWRYATKKFDPARKIPSKEFAELLETLRFSPSSFGLQPWKFIVIKDPELRKKLRPYAWDQSQITDADTLIVFCALKSIDEKHVKGFVQTMARVRGLTRESLAGQEQMMIGALRSMGPGSASHWMKNQVYIALGFFLNECAHRKIDACPMEGFDAGKFDEVLGLPRQGIESVVLCAVGYRALDDNYAQLKKVRFDASDVFINRP